MLLWQVENITAGQLKRVKAKSSSHQSIPSDNRRQDISWGYGLGTDQAVDLRWYRLVAYNDRAGSFRVHQEPSNLFPTGGHSWRAYSRSLLAVLQIRCIRRAGSLRVHQEPSSLSTTQVHFPHPFILTFMQQSIFLHSVTSCILQ